MLYYGHGFSFFIPIRFPFLTRTPPSHPSKTESPLLVAARPLPYALPSRILNVPTRKHLLYQRIMYRTIHNAFLVFRFFLFFIFFFFVISFSIDDTLFVRKKLITMRNELCKKNIPVRETNIDWKCIQVCLLSTTVSYYQGSDWLVYATRYYN